ncbi:hypothetical protein HY522_03225 [bacterium]|nr:hypothetical protein [bacterium]
MAETWAVEGVELPEAFIFPITKLGLMSDIHGKGSFVNTSPTRVDCHVHVEARPESRQGPPRLEILPSPLHPDRGTELAVAYEFEQQFSLALWLYRGLPSRIVAWPSRQTVRVDWSLRGQALVDFLQFSRALLDFHDDRQAYFFARHVAPRAPGVLEDDDIRIFFVGEHPIDADWLRARWPVMAATDLYERARRARDADIGFLLLMMSMEVLLVDGRSELSRRLAQRGAFLNGRDSSERKTIFDGLEALYTRRSRLVHGDVFDKRGFLEVPQADIFFATDLVRLSLLRLIALIRTKSEIMAVLDRAIFDSTVADQLHAQVNGQWEKLGVNVAGLFDVRLLENG